MWTAADRGAAINLTSTNGLFFGVLELVSKSDTHPSLHGRPDRNIFCVSEIFTRDTIWTTLDEGEGGGVSSKRTMLDNGEVSKSQFLLGSL